MRCPKLLIALASLLLTGCINAPEGFDSPEPGKRVRAIARAAREKDQKAIPRLIRFLNSDDPAVRMASIRTLELLTGTTRDYDYAAPEWQRRDQVRVWVEWYNQQHPQEPIGKPRGTGGERPPGEGNSQPGRSNADTVSASGS